ncbi:citrate synthase/methylcitrate synthase [Melghirimyces algeriensis]|uniref:Citrate synthase n=1 Tax=Melghirimyces algeriensis TaxID=910412 RepID=A0A521CPN6_9BACL|nr:citrate synthase/methylcitrate synthase [Melghirimyces algeriensis]SMO61407.1 citrate synthase [Melghirimyces algeriensis]
MKVIPGLEGIAVAETDLSLVDGQKGLLLYRGHLVKKLAVSHSFEEVVYLLWMGQLPSEKEREDFQRLLSENRALPEHIYKLIIQISSRADLMTVLRTAISALPLTNDWPPTLEQGAKVLAVIPTMISCWYHQVQGTDIPVIRQDLNHTAHYLYLLKGQEPSEAHVRALNAYLILTAEHGMNASTFAARVVTSTQSDLLSALTAAVGALKGPLHGGAPSEVEEMLDEIRSAESAESWMRARLESGERLMGFGHRVYKTQDPRAQALRQISEELSVEDDWFQLALETEQTALRLLEEYKPGRRLYTNVEFFAAAVLRAVGLPKALYTPTFALSRTAGWCAHIFDQADHNRIIRPQSLYTGTIPQED